MKPEGLRRLPLYVLITKEKKGKEKAEVLGLEALRVEPGKGRQEAAHGEPSLCNVSKSLSAALYITSFNEAKIMKDHDV